MLGVGGSELVMIFLVILVLFGAKRLPELARGIGQGMNEFKKASDDLKREFDKVQEEARSATSIKSSKRTQSHNEAHQDKQEKSTQN